MNSGIDWKPYVNAVFNKYPGTRLNLLYVITATCANYPYVSVANHMAFSNEIRSSILDRLHKDIVLHKGINGGLALLAEGQGCDCFNCKRGTLDVPLPESCAGEPRGGSTVCGAVAVNDHVCHVCKNDKCSKTEKSCWKCGTPISNEG